MKALAAALALAAVALAGCAGSGSKSPSAAQARVSKPRLLRGATLVVAYPTGEVRACPSGAVLESFPPPAPRCSDGLRLTGVRVGQLTHRVEKPRERWGELELTGVLRDGVFQVVSQRRPAPFTGAPFLPTPPCAAPPGGWHLVAPTPVQESTLFHYFSLAHHDDLTSIAFFHHGRIPVVTSTHPRRTREVLGRYWPDQLCVVRARYPRGLINRVRHRLVRLMRPSARAARYGWISEAGGLSESNAGQPITPITVLIVTPRLRAVLRRQPPGLVVVESILRPVR